MSGAGKAASHWPCGLRSKTMRRRHYTFHPLWGGCGMQMRVTRHHVTGDQKISSGNASGTADNGTGGRQRRPIASDTGVMKFVSAQDRSLGEKWVGRIDPQFTVTVTLRRRKDFNIDWQDVGHGMARSFPDETARQKHEAAALRING